jgi:hypothetical protein
MEAAFAAQPIYTARAPVGEIPFQRSTSFSKSNLKYSVLGQMGAIVGEAPLRVREG